MQPHEPLRPLMAVAISVIVSEDVLLAKIVAAGQILSSAPKSSRFAGNCSMIRLNH